MMIVPGYAWTVHRAGANRKVHRAMGDTNPRFRYDQIMALCWKGLLPLALVNILFTGLIILLMN